VVLPAAAGLDRLAPPDPCGTVEVEEAADAVAGRVLDLEMTVEEDRLDPREQGKAAVDVAPAALDHADLGPALGVGEVGDRRFQEVGTGHEVGVEHGQESAARDAETGLESARLEASAVAPVEMVDVEPEAPVLGHPPRDDRR